MEEKRGAGYVVRILDNTGATATFESVPGAVQWFKSRMRVTDAVTFGFIVDPPNHARMELQVINEGPHRRVEVTGFHDPVE